MTLTRVPIPSPNYSSRGGATVRLVVIHSSEGATSYQSLGNYFADPSAGVSSHVGIDDHVHGVIGEYVPVTGKAWTQGNANPYAVSAELCCPSGASSGWSRADWLARPTMLENCAAWVAEECARFGLPVVALSPAEAQGAGRGVCAHRDLGVWGGNHSDCGNGFPMDVVIDLAGGHVPGIDDEEDDLTPEQDQTLRYVYNMLVSGVGHWEGETPHDVSWLWERLVNGRPDLVETQFGALMTLDKLLRDANNRLIELERRLDAAGVL